jgi:hypothetical protein
MYSTDANETDCIRLLMREGCADTSITSAELSGKTPLEHAINKGDADTKAIRELRCVCGTCSTTPDKNKGKFNKCAACQAMYYCSVECQRVDWPKHKGECEQMKATTEETATKAAAAAAAKAAASHTPVVPCCLACSRTSGAGGAALSKCSRCHEARYCSRACQIKDYPRHKKVCKK